LTWPFVPHVTLFDGADPARIDAALGILDQYTAEVTFEAVHLLREAAGRVWEPVADFAFAARSVIGRGGLPIELSVGDGLDPLARAWARDAWEAHDRGRYGPDRPPSRPFAVTARREGSVVGLAEGRTSGSVCELRRLMVGPSARGEGIGSKLLSAVESLAAERGCATCRLRTEAGGPAQAFYQGRGWVERGRLPDWRNGTDFARMERRLG
ncbi:MAG: GNAT family N-acetyltransferase, partial [Acidimicrobiales bacterium]